MTKIITKGKPVFDNPKSFFIGAYWGPKPLDSLYKIIGESGVTHMFVNTMIGYELESEGYYKTPFLLAKKHGFKIVMHCMSKGFDNIEQYSKEFKKHKNFAGVIAMDEPVVGEYDFFKKDYQEYKKVFPNHPYYINLLPLYSSKAQLGGVDYDEYLELYRQKILRNFDDGNRVLMCDTYPLLEDVKLYPLWLKNIEQLRTIATEDNADLHFYLQDQAFWDRRQPKTLAELTFQAYVYLAYGTKGLSHYPYLTPAGSIKGSAGVVDEQGKKSYMFPLVKKTNELLQDLSTAYYDFDWKAVVSCLGSENLEKKNVNIDSCKNMQKSCGVLEKVESSKDTIIGCFENKKGYQMFMVVNFTEPLHKGENKVTLTIKDYQKAIVYEQGKPSEKDVINGKLTLTLNEGEGAMVIPYNE